MEQGVLKKLRYKEGQASVLNAPDGYQLGVSPSESGTYDFLLLYVHGKEELGTWLPKVIPLLNEEAVFWISYPKATSKNKPDLNRDSLWAFVDEHTAYTAVSNVAIDEKWSAVRFRHKDKTKRKA